MCGSSSACKQHLQSEVCGLVTCVSREADCLLWGDQVWSPRPRAVAFSCRPQHQSSGQGQFLPAVNKPLRCKSCSFRCVSRGTLAASPGPPPQYSLGMFARWPRPAGSWFSLGKPPGLGLRYRNPSFSLQLNPRGL